MMHYVQDVNLGDYGVGDYGVGDPEVGAAIQKAVQHGIQKGLAAHGVPQHQGHQGHHQGHHGHQGHMAPRIAYHDPVTGHKETIASRPMVEKIPYGELLNFFQALVPAGIATQVRELPAVEFIPKSMTIDDTVNPNFQITDISIGVTRVFANVQVMNAAQFSPGNFHSAVKWPLAPISQQVTITVVNTALGPTNFAATIWGTAFTG